MFGSYCANPKLPTCNYKEDKGIEYRSYMKLQYLATALYLKKNQEKPQWYWCSLEPHNPQTITAFKLGQRRQSATMRTLWLRPYKVIPGGFNGGGGPLERDGHAGWCDINSGPIFAVHVVSVGLMDLWELTLFSSSPVGQCWTCQVGFGWFL